MILKNIVYFLIAVLFIGCQKDEPKNSPDLIKQTFNERLPATENDDEVVNIENATRSRAKEALLFVQDHKMNEDFCILIDMSIHSGRKRFFVWDFKREEVMHRFLVGHGCGNNTWSGDDSKDDPVFSNVENSHATSLGKYRIGERGNSDWGVHIKYLMHGLEESNDNALKRFIVFHSWEMVSNEEVFPAGTPEGWGCPTVSNESFAVIDPMLKISSRPVLMWIYGKDK